MRYFKSVVPKFKQLKSDLFLIAGMTALDVSAWDIHRTLGIAAVGISFVILAFVTDGEEKP